MCRETQKIIQINEADQVGVAIKNIVKNEDITIEALTLTIKALDHIPVGHKMALQFIECGEKIRKYGQIMGVATQDILPGHHVHLHNLKSERGGV